MAMAHSFVLGIVAQFRHRPLCATAIRRRPSTVRVPLMIRRATCTCRSGAPRLRWCGGS